MIISLATKIINGLDPAKVSPSQCVISPLETLRTLLHPSLTLIPSHVQREANKVVDKLANQGVSSQAKDILIEAQQLPTPPLLPHYMEIALRDCPPRMGWQLTNIRDGQLITQAAALSLSLFRMSRIHSMGMVVWLRRKKALMAHSRWGPKSAWPGTSRMRVVNSTLVVLSTVNSATIMEVRNGNCHLVRILVPVWTLASPSHSRIFYFGCPLPLLVTNLTPTIPMPREKGNPKRGSTYYSFVAQHHRPGPSSAPVPHPISNVHPVGPSLDNSPFFVQN